MKAFATLVHLLGNATGTLEKLHALSHYFSTADPKDRVWVIAIFSGRRPKRAISTTQLKQWCIESTDLQEWLFEECYHTVGDLAETIGLLLPPPSSNTENLPLHYYIERLIQLQNEEDKQKKKFIIEVWQELGKDELFVFNKLITGGFRIGVSQKMMVNALAKATALDASLVAHKISGNWDPQTISFDQLLLNDHGNNDDSKPYPFYLAHALDGEPHDLGAPSEWQAEWKWDGIRGQIIKRNGTYYVWSRGEELMTDKFPEYNSFIDSIPDGTVLDGEILPAKDGQPLSFSVLQTRIGRKTITKKQLVEAPIAFFAYDLLEWKGKDIRHIATAERRALLEDLITSIQHLPNIFISPSILFNNWDELISIRENARENHAEGLMLKRKKGPYQVGRKTGDWWKWKIDPLTIDAVMIYAQKGHGRRSNLYTDYTFAVKDGDKLVSFTKAYSGLTDKEFAQVDAFVKKNSIEKFGPVRTVKPELVFEIAFEGIAASSRHKSGVALRFPRINRWRTDKKPDEINTLDDLKQLLAVYGK
ncbi:MAG: ATP-dependent DNA ligase [Chitinophagaceae bacterium]|nr:ATP-dependent DNA ligase [Chitinophagaceae bacterium]